MANFVLVHGAWHGAWCWRRVVAPLAQAGHRVYAVTLTGLGDRAHLMSRDITLSTHVQDIVRTIESEELSDVVLAVHSYAGMLGTAVADLMPERLSHLVYIDAVVPQPGESWASTHTRATRSSRTDAAEASPDYSFPAPDPKVFGLEAEDHAWVLRRQTRHPGRTYETPLDFDVNRVASVPRTFISCTRPALATIDSIRPRVTNASFWGGAWLTGSRFVELVTGHDPMISAPVELTRLLLEAAATPQ